MDYIKIRFGDDMNRLTSDLERTLENMFRSVGPGFRLSECAWKPQMDLYETSDTVVILGEIAGITKDDLEIEINRRAVRIRGMRSMQPKIENATYRLAEIQYGRFERVLLLSAPVDPEKVEASYTNGLLQIKLVKLPQDVTYRVPISEG